MLDHIASRTSTQSFPHIVRGQKELRGKKLLSQKIILSYEYKLCRYFSIIFIFSNDNKQSGLGIQNSYREINHHLNIEGLFRGPPAAHGYDTPEVRKKEDPKVGIMAKEGGKGRTIAGPPAG